MRDTSVDDSNRQMGKSGAGINGMGEGGGPEGGGKHPVEDGMGVD